MKNMQNQFEELREKVNKILSQQMDSSEIEKKLANMKDSINLLKAEVKVMADRESKSGKRVSIEKIDPNPQSVS